MTTLSGWTIDLSTSPRSIIIPVGDETATAQDQVDTVRKLEDQFLSMGHPRLMDASGKAGGGVTGIVIELQDCQYLFQARSTVLESGTVTTANARGVVLNDSTALFVTNLVSRGDLVLNSTSTGYATVIDVVSETQLKTRPIIGGTDSRWDMADAYNIFSYTSAKLTSGDLFAVDSVGSPIDSVLNTFGVGPAFVEQDTSPSATPPSVSDMWTTLQTEAYPADGVSSVTPIQLLYSINQMLSEFQRTGTLVSVKERDGATEAFEITLDSGTAPTTATQSS